MPDVITTDSSMYVASTAWTLLSTISWICSLALVIYFIVCRWKLLVKANMPGWASIVPFYNIYKECELVWGSGWKMFLFLIPIYNIILAIEFPFDLAKRFNKSTWFGFGLLFLNPIFLWILAFWNSTYTKAE